MDPAAPGRYHRGEYGTMAVNSSPDKPQVFRSPTALVVWIVWLLFAVANWIDLAVQGRDHTSAVAAATLLLATGVAYVTTQRPRIIADKTGLTIRNPLRDHRIAWSAVAQVDVADLLRVHCEWGGPAPGPPGATGLIPRPAARRRWPVLRRPGASPRDLQRGSRSGKDRPDTQRAGDRGPGRGRLGQRHGPSRGGRSRGENRGCRRGFGRGRFRCRGRFGNRGGNRDRGRVGSPGHQPGRRHHGPGHRRLACCGQAAHEHLERPGHRGSRHSRADPAGGLPSLSEARLW